MESIGLYHQTRNGTSQFLLAKSISRPDSTTLQQAQSHVRTAAPFSLPLRN
jgi:hypothetical protein